jgi:hypothetical protein
MTVPPDTDFGIRTYPWGTVATGVGVDVYRILALRGRMELEMKGLRFRGRTTYAILKSEFGLRGSRASVYRQFCHMHQLQTEAERKEHTL